MKAFILFLTLMSFNPEVFAMECMIKETTSGKVLVLPHYEASVNYFFDEGTREAFATVSWYLNEEKTKECFKETQFNYATREVAIPRVQASQLVISVKGAFAPATLNFFPQANGHLFGVSDSIKVSYSMKQELQNLLAADERLVDVSGDLSFVMTTMTPKVLTTFDCSKESEEAGVLNLSKRLKELEAAALKVQNSGKVIMENIFQEFLGTCVTFKNVEATSFGEFERQQRLNSVLKRVKFQIVGTVPVTTSEPLVGVASQKITILDI